MGHFLNLIKITIIAFIAWYDLAHLVYFPRKLDPYLATYLDEFVQDAKSHGVSVDPMEIGSLEFDEEIEYPTVGITSPPYLFGRLFWGIPYSVRVTFIPGPISLEFFKVVAYHEFGHGLCHLDHNKNTDVNNIMNPWVDLPKSDEEWANWKITLFNSCKESLK